MNTPLFRALAGSVLLLALPHGPLAGAQCVDNEDQRFTVSNPTNNDHFTNAIDIDGTRAAIGAQWRGLKAQGNAFIFERTGDTWSEVTMLGPSDPSDNDYFGSEVSLDGNWLAISAEADDDDTLATGGSIYMFEDNGVSFVQQQELRPADSQFLATFGNSTDLVGTRLLAGSASWDSLSFVNEGCAYVFDYNGASWNQTAQLFTSNPGAARAFGNAVAQHSAGLLIAASEDNFLHKDSGAVHFFTHDGTGWVEEDILYASDATPNLGFGIDIAVSGDVLLVGSMAEKVYSFRWDGTQWNEEQIFTASDSKIGDRFGMHLALDGSLAAIGAHWQVQDGDSFSGAAYAFRHDGNDWLEVEKCLPTNSAERLYFAQELAVGGDHILAGTEEDIGVLGEAGAAYAYTVPDIALDAQPGTVNIGDPLTLLTCGGTPGSLAKMYIVAVDSIPFTLALFTGSFDANGAWSLPLVVPNSPTLQGHTTDLMTFSLSGGGVVASNVESLTVQ